MACLDAIKFHKNPLLRILAQVGLLYQKKMMALFQFVLRMGV